MAAQTAWFWGPPFSGIGSLVPETELWWQGFRFGPVVLASKTGFMESKLVRVKHSAETAIRRRPLATATHFPWGPITAGSGPPCMVAIIPPANHVAHL